MQASKKPAKTNIKIKDLKTRKNPKGGVILTSATAQNAMQSTTAMQSSTAMGMEGGMPSLTSVNLNKSISGSF